MDVLSPLLDDNYDISRLEGYLENYILDSDFYVDEVRYLNKVIDEIFTITHQLKNPNNNFNKDDLISAINRISRPDFNLRRDFASLSNQLEYRFDMKKNAEGIYDDLISVHSTIVNSYESYNENSIMNLNNNAKEYMDTFTNKNMSSNNINKKEVQTFLLKLLVTVNKRITEGFDDEELTLATAKVDIDLLLNELIKGTLDYEFKNDDINLLDNFLNSYLPYFNQIMKVLAEARNIEQKFEESEKASSKFL